VKDYCDIAKLRVGARVPKTRFGERAARLSDLLRFGLPVPNTVAISINTVRGIASGRIYDAERFIGPFRDGDLLAVKASPGQTSWGGAESILNVGMNESKRESLSRAIGPEAAASAYFKFVYAYAVNVARLDAESFDAISARDLDSESKLGAALRQYEDDIDEPFPQSPSTQLLEVLRCMARAWEGSTARILRQARGAPEDAGLGLIVQLMVSGHGPGLNGTGYAAGTCYQSGGRAIAGRFFKSDSDSGSASIFRRDPAFGDSESGMQLRELDDSSIASIESNLRVLREGDADSYEIAFAFRDGELSVLDARPAPRTARAAVRIAVDLVEDGILPVDDALVRVEPGALVSFLHAQVKPTEGQKVLARGTAASPGAASGGIAFSASDALIMAAQGRPCILVRAETGPEDIRGIYTASGVLTGRGGITSHAAVIARGLGVPCVAGAADIKFDAKAKKITCRGGESFGEGDLITVNGTNGEVLDGAAVLVEPRKDDAFAKFMEWADSEKDIGVRANADTPDEARAALGFGAEGIGLCRTEHMFFEQDRLTVVREMIFAGCSAERRAVLDKLLPMQRSDFEVLFEIMQGLPVCIRLFDPPLHEFLPSGREEIRELADALALPVSRVVARVDELREFNPMLGMRGVRLGITMPEIYEMQARAIFEAAVNTRRVAKAVIPEIMIPLVSANREVELIKQMIESVAADVESSNGIDISYRLGVMVETPRAALRAADLAESSSFLSFGTNDLTQMAYGLSRDDAGRFMDAYVSQGVYRIDPFQTLDMDGVGELLLLAAERGKATRPDIVLSICGEHGGDPDTIEFCRNAGFSYVSCSPFRVPIAKLAAAQCAIRNRKQDLPASSGA